MAPFTDFTPPPPKCRVVRPRQRPALGPALLPPPAPRLPGRGHQPLQPQARAGTSARHGSRGPAPHDADGCTSITNAPTTPYHNVIQHTPTPPPQKTHSARRTAGTSSAGATTGAATCGTPTAAASSAASTARGPPPSWATRPRTRALCSRRPSRAQGPTRSWPSHRTWRPLSTPTWRRPVGCPCRPGRGTGRCSPTWSCWTTRWRRRPARRSAGACLWTRWV